MQIEINKENGNKIKKIKPEKLVATYRNEISEITIIKNIRLNKNTLNELQFIFSFDLSIRRQLIKANNGKQNGL